MRELAASQDEISEKEAILEDNNTKSLHDFFMRIAKAWQSYISYSFINEVNLSDTQVKVVDFEEDQILINGCAGSGKSIVLLYKLIKTMLQETERKRILYISYNQVLIDDTRKRAERSKEFREGRGKHYLELCTFHTFAYNLLKNMGYDDVNPINMEYTKMKKADGNTLRRTAAVLYKYLEKGEYYSSLDERGRLFSTHDEKFISEEILWMKANGYVTEDSYLECERNGRGNTPRLIKIQRSTVFKIFNEYNKELKSNKYGSSMDLEDYALKLLENIEQIPKEYRYDYIFVDEVQDLDAMQLKLLALLKPKSLIIAGDPKQRIYKRTPHSYANLGINLIGKNRTLYENFRSTKQIMNLANSLNFIDEEKDNKKIRYAREGAVPQIRHYKNYNKLLIYLVSRIKEIHRENKLATVSIITREENKMAVGEGSNLKKGLEAYFSIIDIRSYKNKFSFGKEKQVLYTDAYNVKGLEFDYVFVLHFDKYHYPSKDRLDKIRKYSSSDEEIQRDLDAAINDEKKLLYVAVTRAKQELELLYVSSYEENISPFVKDFDQHDFNSIGFKKSVLRNL